MNAATVDRTLLQRQTLFKPLNDEQLQRMTATARAIDLTEGQQLFAQSQPAEHFYLVVSGLVKLARLSEDGHEKIVELVNGGRLIGEAILFMEQQRYPVDATALADSRLYAFRNQTYRSLLGESIELCFALCGHITKRLHGLLDEVDRLSLQNASLRVVNYLSGLLPDGAERAAVIDLAAPKQVIAARLSITPETLSRILRTLTDQGIISLHGKTVGVHDARRLREFGHHGPAPYGPRRP